VINNILFLVFNLAVFWTMYWAWKQDELSERDGLKNANGKQE
jgi:hypothetical protein